MASRALTGDDAPDQVTGGEFNEFPINTPLTREEQRAFERAERSREAVEAARAAASSGKGNPPSVLDTYRASMRPEYRPPAPGAKMQTGMGGPIAPTPYAPPLSLDPRNVDHLLPTNAKGEREHSDVLALMRGSFDSAYKALDAVSKARVAASANESWTPAAQLMHVGKFAEQHLDRVTQSFDRSQRVLTELIAGYDKTLSAPLEGGADTPRAREIREHVKNLPEAKRGEFVGKALERNDTKTLQAILGAEAFLSGLGESHHAYFTRKFRESSNPVVTTKLETARKGLELLEARIGVLFLTSEFERAMGGSFSKLKKIREANSAAEAALIMTSGLE